MEIYIFENNSKKLRKEPSATSVTQQRVIFPIDVIWLSKKRIPTLALLQNCNKRFLKSIGVEVKHNIFIVFQLIDQTGKFILELE